MIHVVGYGSLLSEASARRTVPSLQRFRVVRVPGYVRIFNKVSVVWPRRDPDPDPRAVAVLAARERPGATFLATAFAVPEDEFASLRERERDYAWSEVEVEASDGEAIVARICVERPLDGDLWRDDILPCPPYLDLCLSAARSLGPDVHEDFLDTTLLADGRALLRDHL